MATIAEVTVPAESLALASLFDEYETAAVDVERLASHSREWVMPALWLSAADPRAAARTIEADPAVEGLELVDVDDGTAYLMIHWGVRVQRLIDAVVDRHGVVKEASATDGRWAFTLKFRDRDALTDFQTHTADHDLSVDLRRLGETAASAERGYGLTTEQREAMDVALDMGYFGVPREAQLSDLADALGISTNSASERLRRGTAALTANTIG